MTKNKDGFLEGNGIIILILFFLMFGGGWGNNSAVQGALTRAELADGQKWTPDQCYEVGQKVGIDFNKITKYEWYSIMNMAYSDYYKTAKSIGMQDDPIFYARLGKDWLNDEDAPDGSKKLYNYYFSVVCA